MDKQKRRTGGVIDPSDIPKLPDPVAFAEKHGFPNHVEMENLLTKARLSAAIRRDIAPRYSKQDALDHFDKLENGLSRLIENLHTEPYFSNLALARSGHEREAFIFQLQRSLSSLSEARGALELGKFQLPNATQDTGRPPADETEFLIELKEIHLKTGKDRRVTWDDYRQIYKGKFVLFVEDCLALDGVEITNAALGQQIKKLPRRSRENKAQK